VANRKAIDVDATVPGLAEGLDAVGREHEIEVERPVLQLNEILAALEIGDLGRREGKAELGEGGGDCFTVGWRLLDEQIRILGRVGKALATGRLVEPREWNTPSAGTSERPRRGLRSCACPENTSSRGTSGAGGR